MYIEEQPSLTVERGQIAAKAADMLSQGYRLVQICCVSAERFEVTYTFDKSYSFQNIRVYLDRGDPSVPSITGSYLAAFTYENELQDLFGLTVTGLALDFHGTFYRTAQKAAFSAPPAQPAQAAADSAKP